MSTLFVMVTSLVAGLPDLFTIGIAFRTGEAVVVPSSWVVAAAEPVVTNLTTEPLPDD